MDTPDKFSDRELSVRRYTDHRPLLEYLREFIEDHVGPRLYQADGPAKMSVSLRRTPLAAADLATNEDRNIGELNAGQTSLRTSAGYMPHGRGRRPAM